MAEYNQLIDIFQLGIYNLDAIVRIFESDM